MNKQDKPTVQETALTPKNTQGISIEDLINKALENKAAIATVERIFAMRKDLKAEWAKEEFDKAMAGFQSECPIIKKTKSVGNDKGKTYYKYTPFEELDSQTKSLREKYGFSYKTDQRTFVDNGATMVEAIVTVTHKSGHSEKTPFTAPIGTKTDIMSSSQVVAAAYTFAKRYAFKNAFGITEADEDNEALLKKGDITETALPKDFLEKLDKATTHEDMVKICKEFVDANPTLRKPVEAAYTQRKNELEAIDLNEVEEGIEKKETKSE